jgi:hypothetical protein
MSSPFERSSNTPSNSLRTVCSHTPLYPPEFEGRSNPSLGLGADAILLKGRRKDCRNP